MRGFPAAARRWHGWGVSALAAAVLLGGVPRSAQAQLNAHCTISVLNRTVTVNHDGTWLLPNVPAGSGRVKARATCVDDGVTRSGESDYFTITPDKTIVAPAIVFGAPSPIPTSLRVTPVDAVLETAGATVTLTVTATYPDDSTGDVTAASTGTNYTTSNAAVATVSPDGVVTAVTSGRVIILASSDRAPGMLVVTVSLSGTDTDGDGIADDIEAALGLDPTNPVDALDDADRDGLTTLREVELGTNPALADTAGDGLSGRTEADATNGFATNPLLRDTDGDGISDGLEILTESDWSCELAVMVNPAYAAGLTTAHEVGADATATENVMDLNNSAAGIAIAAGLSAAAKTRAACQAAVKAAVDGGAGTIYLDGSYGARNAKEDALVQPTNRQ